MVELVFTGLAILAVGSFVLGKIYGARVEAKAIAAELKARTATVRAYTEAYNTVVKDIRAFKCAALTRLSKFLS